MLFDLNGNTYQVKFSRENPLHHKYPLTIASLFIKDGENFTSLGIEAVSKCNLKDKFEKSKGRKIALAKLLKVMNDYDRVIPLELTKEDRTKIWEIYFKEHKK